LATGDASYNDQTIVLNLSGVTVSPGDIITVTIADSTIQSAIDGTYVTGQTFQNVDIFNCANSTLYLDSYVTNYATGTGTWNDLSSSGNDATLINTPGYSTTFDGYLTFDGTSDYATIPSSSTVLNFGTSAFSVSFWINLAVSTNQTILTNYNSYNANYATYFAIVYYQPSLGLGVIDSAGTIVTGSTITTSTWTHYCFTKTGTTFKTYKNGVLAHSATSASNNYSGTGRTVLIGGGLSDYPYMNGSLVSLQVFNVEVSGAAALYMYNRTKARFGL